MLRFKKFLLGLLVTALVWVPSGARAKEIVVATSATVLTNLPYWVAIERKFFEQAGLTVQYVVMRSDLAVKGLITGDVDYNQSSSSVLRAAAAGAPVVTVAGIFNRTFFELVARSDIKSLSDLKGKPVGISRHGASTEHALRFGLKANGIDPDRDIKMLAVGGEPARIAGLQSGTLAASVLQVPSNLFAHKLGGHTLLNLGDYMETLLAGAGTSWRKVEQNREEVKNVIHSLMRAVEFMRERSSEAKEIIQRKLGVDGNVAQSILALVVKYASRDGIPSRKALENTLIGTPFEGKSVSFDKFADFSIARELAQGK
ncbi:MAG: ABC transporter substrate-binding protein [Deltaproteobacteria bacterium]|nr:ABC transporter substrate-binding protein [Deltaproteobacteria bacterium]